MTKRSQSRRAWIKEYVVGAALANGPESMLNAFRDIIQTRFSLVLQLLILFITTMAGGAWAGYLMARRTGNIRAGLIVGFLSFLIYLVLLPIISLLGWIPLEVPTAFIGFLVGGALGSRYSKTNLLVGKF